MAVTAPPQGILFDFGSTLVHEEAFDPEAGTRRVLSLARNPLGLTVRDVCELVAELQADLLARREASWIEVSPFTVQRLVYEPHSITFDLSFHEVELEFWRAATQFRPTEGIEELLEGLQSAGLPFGVVSNSMFTGQTVSWQVNRLGLGQFFEFVMSSADYVVRKPHPAILLTAAKKLGVAPAHTWYVGDSPAHDVAGAANAGMLSVLYRPQGGEAADPRPDVEVQTWGELLERVQALQREANSGVK